MYTLLLTDVEAEVVLQEWWNALSTDEKIKIFINVRDRGY